MKTARHETIKLNMPDWKRKIFRTVARIIPIKAVKSRLPIEVRFFLVVKPYTAMIPKVPAVIIKTLAADVAVYIASMMLSHNPVATE